MQNFYEVGLKFVVINLIIWVCLKKGINRKNSKILRIMIFVINIMANRNANL